ncbi:hypothetical protein O181_057909 [Austropuccinia psidii MF-1]|uniref:CCHC-type domain-containing protein n=1 Tax=Austropuccinia psidii MF-1 TaxID=1389203 RepID=A0A9Q3EBF2_9BASI|nr:hypothetical protein [Austropuccinia psidii MF-1]
MQPEEHPSSFLHWISNSISAFKNRGGNFTEDLVTGLILQEAVTPPSLRSAVLSHLEAYMTANQTNPSFPTCAMVLKSCYQQAKTTSHDDITTALQPSFNSLRLDKTTTGDSFSHSSINPAFFQATVKGACFNCNKPGHFASSCPLVKKKNLTLSFHSMPPRAPMHFQANYPIITPLLLEVSNL